MAWKRFQSFTMKLARELWHLTCHIRTNIQNTYLTVLWILRLCVIYDFSGRHCARPIKNRISYRPYVYDVYTQSQIMFVCMCLSLFLSFSLSHTHTSILYYMHECVHVYAFKGETMYNSCPSRVSNTWTHPDKRVSYWLSVD